MTNHTDTQNTHMRNARIAGFAFLFYIVIGIQKAPNIGVGVVFTLLMCLSALVLGVTLYAITRDQDRDIAMLGLTCRVAEGILGAMFIPTRLAMDSLATDLEAASTLEAFFSTARSWNPVIAATFFAVGSILFCWLLLRGRRIPVGLAWLGVVASVVLVVGLPLQLAGVISGTLAQIMWIPMAAFEIPLGFWMLIKGVRMPEPTAVPARTAEAV